MKSSREVVDRNIVLSINLHAVYGHNKIPAGDTIKTITKLQYEVSVFSLASDDVPLRQQSMQFIEDDLRLLPSVKSALRSLTV